MERFVIEVEKRKAKFFNDLIENFDFAKVVKVDSIVEPRIYPAADFEIRPDNQTTKRNDKSKKQVSSSITSSDISIKLSALDESEKNLKQIRDAMSAIDRQREEYRK
jgi:hypothetical protein